MISCPQCNYQNAPEDALYCPNCSASLGNPAGVEIRQDVGHNYGRVVGVETGVIQGDVYGNTVQQVQIYVLSDAGRDAGFRGFVNEHTPPYKFLSPYTAQDRVLFSGRDTEIERVVRQIGEQRLLVIHGTASVGKTSLLAAGVIPELMKNGALLVRIQDYVQPGETIRNALAECTEISLQLPDEPTLPSLVQTVLSSTKGTLVLVLDQFERFFERPVSDEQRELFIQGLADALRDDKQGFLRVVIALREESLGKLGKLQDHVPDLLRSAFKLRPLSLQQAQAAIEEPPAKLNNPVSYVGNLVTEQLVPDLDDLTPDLPGFIYPPHLQIVCHWLYQAARENSPPHIDEKLYGGAKGAEGILARYLDDTLRTELAGERALAECVLTAMATHRGERWVLPADLQSCEGSLDQLLGVLERLEKTGVLISSVASGERKYAFTNQTMATEAGRLAGPEGERQIRAESELERVWAAWLLRDVLATRGQLRYLAAAGAHLSPRPVESLLLVRSAVARNEPVGPWLTSLRSDEGRVLIQQLEAPDDSNHRLNSRSTLEKAESLVGLPDANTINHQGDVRGGFGSVAGSAASHPESVTRQTAALALMVLDQDVALGRLDRALRTGVNGWEARKRRAELRGTLADADPEIERLNSDLSPLNRALVWIWRVRRRVFRDWHSLLGLTVAGAIGAGLSLGVLRWSIAALLSNPIAGVQGSIAALLSSPMVVVQAAMYFYWGGILGGALALGIALTEPILLLRPEETGQAPPIGQAPAHSSRIAAWLAVFLGMLFFGIAHMGVAVFNGLSLSETPLVIPMGFLAGLGLSAALYGQPRAGWRLGVRSWLLRIVVAALIFILTQSIFIIAGDGIDIDGIAIAWTNFYSEFSTYKIGCPQCASYLALIDAGLVGIFLAICMTFALVWTAERLAKWRALVGRAGD